MVTAPSSTTQISLVSASSTLPQMCASCVMSTTPPSNSSSAVPSASMDSMSRWFVGSSISRMCGLESWMLVNTTRAFWPPLSFTMGVRWL